MGLCIMGFHALTIYGVMKHEKRPSYLGIGMSVATIVWMGIELFI